MVDPPYSNAKIIRHVSATTNRGVQKRSMNDLSTELSLYHTRHSPPCRSTLRTALPEIIYDRWTTLSRSAFKIMSVTHLARDAPPPFFLHCHFIYQASECFHSTLASLHLSISRFSSSLTSWDRKKKTDTFHSDFRKKTSFFVIIF